MPAANKEFPEGVKVDAEHQANNKTVRIDKGTLPAPLPSDSNGFKPRRGIINLKLDLGTTLAAGNRVNFAPPVTVRLRYKQDDLNHATGAGKTRPDFYYLDGNTWVPFSNAQPVTDSTPGFVGAVEVKISDWPGDPPIGTGP